MAQLVGIVTQLAVAAVVIFICASVQTLYNIGLLYWVLRLLRRAEQRMDLVWRMMIVVKLIFAFIFIHFVQITIWATSYLLLGCFPTLEEALFFSFAVFSTSDTGSVTLPNSWRLLGPAEGLAGIIGFGLSVGFIFTVISRLQASRARQSSGTAGPYET